MSILWTIIIGFIAGVVAKFLMPGKNEPSGFILTTILGIVGAFVATFLGQALGFYAPGEGAGFIGAVVGAIVVLVRLGNLRQEERGLSYCWRPVRQMMTMNISMPSQTSREPAMTSGMTLSRPVPSRMASPVIIDT